MLTLLCGFGNVKTCFSQFDDTHVSEYFTSFEIKWTKTFFFLLKLCIKFVVLIMASQQFMLNYLCAFFLQVWILLVTLGIVSNNQFLYSEFACLFYNKSCYVDHLSFCCLRFIFCLILWTYVTPKCWIAWKQNMCLLTSFDMGI